MKIIRLPVMLQTAALASMDQAYEDLSLRNQKSNSQKHSIKLINKSFNRKADAEKVTRLLIQKLSKRHYSPTVEEEMAGIRNS